MSNLPAASHRGSWHEFRQDERAGSFSSCPGQLSMSMEHEHDSLVRSGHGPQHARARKKAGPAERRVGVERASDAL